MSRQQWLVLIAAAIGLSLLLPLSAALLGIRYGYTLRTVTLGAALLGLVSGILGSFAVQRKESLLGDTLSHAALPGVAIAFLLAGRQLSWLLIGAGLSGWIAVLFISAVIRTTRLKQDTAMGIALSVSFACGVALLGYIQGRADASQAGLDRFIFGQAAAIVQKDIVLIGQVSVVIFIIIALFWKELKLLTFDPEFASTNGFPVRALDLLLSTLIVVAIVLGLQLAGVILMVGMLIAPAVAARQWSHSLEQTTLLSGYLGAFAGAMGAILSAADTGLPTGPLIIVVASLVVVMSLALAPERGLVWMWLKNRQDRRQFISQFVLEDMARLCQRHQNMGYGVPEGMLISLRGSLARRALHQLAQAEFIEAKVDGRWALTPAGLAHLQTKDTNHHPPHPQVKSEQIGQRV